jgi:hypothetical protein
MIQYVVDIALDDGEAVNSAVDPQLTIPGDRDRSREYFPLSRRSVRDRRSIATNLPGYLGVLDPSAVNSSMSKMSRSLSSTRSADLD